MGIRSVYLSETLAFSVRRSSFPQFLLFATFHRDEFHKSVKCEDLNLADPLFAEHYADVVAAEPEGSEVEIDDGTPY